MPRATHSVVLAVLAAELVAGSGARAAPTEIRLLPAGSFRSGDIRPAECAAWVLDQVAADRLVIAAAARQSDYVIDFEHQTLLARDNGKPAPASGWFKKLEARPDGLYATDVRWTANAAAMIKAGEYRYISPVFAYDTETGVIQALASAALVNTPGLDGLTDLSVALAALSLTFPTPEKDVPMKLILAALGLAVTATEDEALVALNALKATHTVALSAASSATPNPAQYVGIAVLSAVQGELATTKNELAALKAASQVAEVDAVVVAALAAGKLTPATEAWARDLGKTHLAALNSFIAAAPASTKPGTTQTGGKAPAGGEGVAALSADQLKLCGQMNVKPEDFQKTLAAEQAA